MPTFPDTENPLVTVVVPVFQVEGYLDACVRSLVGQSHRKIEVLLIDDGSTDGSGERCDAWAKEDPRIRVFHTENRGLSEARNLGIEEARGGFLLFVDSDDVVAGNIVGCLLTHAVESGSDMAVTGLLHFDGEPPQFDTSCRAAVIEPARDVLLRNARSGKGWAACGKLYRRSLFAHLRFDPGLLYEDLELLPRLLVDCDTVVTLAEPLYGYRVRAGGIMGTSRRRMSTDLLDILERHIHSAETSIDRDALEAGYVRHAYGALTTIDLRHMRDNKAFVAAYRAFMLRHGRRAILNRGITLKRRLELAGSVILPTLLIRAKQRRRRQVRERNHA